MPGGCCTGAVVLECPARALGPESGMAGSLPRVARGILCCPAPKRSLQKGPSRGRTSQIADSGVAVRDGTRPNGGGRGEDISQEDPGFT